jgi:nitroreductase
MDVLEAIQARYSVRDFLPTPLPKELILKIMQVATRSPSGDNSQPWEIFVASGEALEQIRRAYQERMLSSGGRPGNPAPLNSTAPPPPLPVYIQERRATIRSAMAQLLGFDPADPAFEDHGRQADGSKQHHQHIPQPSPADRGSSAV